ncbi:Homeobox protein TGIF1 [Pseudocercospora fuligena]|uniref:Homeobox protein TGIF1 n=1 Tax=Pseudocercospora fuligena TaxID=685502 RepID=A0A8H6VN36_9PEZI|nr:Homeobox protein TGIF1 [Pseudocercospora fuligena]
MPESVIMESLSLSDGQPYHRHSEHYYHSKDRRHRSPRLPTPENSRSSNEALDSTSPYEGGPAIRNLLSRPGPERTMSLGLPHGATHFRRDSRNTGAPHSPPYGSGDMQKPSLPPLKTVLGDNISSPPRTPSPRGSPMQPGPREPSYTTSTFKPPALYPNKKQRTEPALRSAPPYPGADRINPTFPPSTTLDRRPDGSSVRGSSHYPSLSAQMDIDSRRPSMHTLTAPHTAISPPWGSQYHSAKSSSSRSSFETSASHYQTPEQTPTSIILEPAFPRMSSMPGSVQDPFAREMRDSFSHSSERPTSRRGSTSGYGAYPPAPYDREPSRPGPHQQGSRYSIPVRHGYAEPRDSMRYGRPEEQQPRSINGYPQHSYQSHAPAFFMPSHYEYQHGKARKRSNLPKQSTEIMKQWFDQNISNPYPSEEQKAIFSNATGISMTQVSNWFINHRRRCPELRDKREKSRGGSRDCDS